MARRGQPDDDDDDDNDDDDVDANDENYLMMRIMMARLHTSAQNCSAYYATVPVTTVC